MFIGTILAMDMMAHTVNATNYEANSFLQTVATNTAGNTGLYSSYGTGTTSCPAILPLSATATNITSETVAINTATIRCTVLWTQ